MDIVSSFVFHLFVCLFVCPTWECLLSIFWSRDSAPPVCSTGSCWWNSRCCCRSPGEGTRRGWRSTLPGGEEKGCCDSFSFLSNRCGEDLILIVMDTKTSTVKTAFCRCFPKTETEKDSPDVLRGLCCQRRHWLCPDEAPWCFGPLQPGGSWFLFLWFQFLPKFDT